MDIYPSERNFHLRGSLFYVNKVEEAIDTILVGSSFKDDVSIELRTPSELIDKDVDLRYYTFVLDTPILKGDSIELWIDIKNYPNTLLHDNSRVNSNGTFITAQVLPTLGVREAFLSNLEKRKKYGLGERKVRELLPSDSTLLGYGFYSNTMGRIDYETKITTAKDQEAFSMGELIESGIRDGRGYFHYKSKGPIKNAISWLSGVYTKDKGEVLDIYHHPEHVYNIDYLREGSLDSKNYCEKWFSPLQYDHLSMIEFPLTEGTYATVHGNIIPFSEVKMLCDIDHKKNNEYNHPYFVAAHEMAHYWWGYKVDPANVKGGQLLSEAMAEYISKKAVERRFGREVIRKDRSKEQDIYFEIRAREANEVPLNHAEIGQEYLNYVKGGLALTTLSEYVGEEKFNMALARFEKGFRYREPPFASSLNFIDTLRTVVPDSLSYLVEDLFETITIYDNQVLSAQLSNGLLTVEVDIRKYRSDGTGKRTEVLDFEDYIRLALVDRDGNEKVSMLKVGSGLGEFRFEIDEDITMVRLDPDGLLLDPDRGDNEVKIEQQL